MNIHIQYYRNMHNKIHSVIFLLPRIKNADKENGWNARIPKPVWIISTETGYLLLEQKKCYCSHITIPRGVLAWICQNPETYKPKFHCRRQSGILATLLRTEWTVTKKFQNKSKNIDEVYQSVFFRCIIFLSYRVTFLCNVLGQIHYTSESPVRYFFMKKL